MDAKKEYEEDENVVWFVNDVSRCWQSYSVAVGHDSVAARSTTTTTRLPSLPPSLIPRIEQRRASDKKTAARQRARQRKTGKEKK